MPTTIRIMLELHPESADPEHETGLTEDAHMALSLALGSFGDIVDISRDEDA